MFSNASKGSILYVLQTKDTIKLLNGPITDISLPRPKYTTITPNNIFGQQMETVVDITANINGERREFRQIPGNLTIANFGPDSIILADSRESMLEHVNALLQNSRNIVQSIDKHKTLITQYEDVIKQLNPYLATTPEQDSVIQNLQNKVNSLEGYISEMLSLLKEDKNKSQQYGSNVQNVEGGKRGTPQQSKEDGEVH